MKFIDVSGVQFDCPVSFTGAVDLSAGTITLPTTQFQVKRYVSQSIVHGDLTAGSATCTVALTGEPTGIIPIAAYAVTSVTTTSGNGSTTGLTVKIGPSGDDDGFLPAVSIFGAASRKEGTAPGAMLGSYRASDALIATFTATGGAAAIAHITAMAVKIVVLYLEVAAE